MSLYMRMCKRMLLLMRMSAPTCTCTSGSVSADAFTPISTCTPVFYIRGHGRMRGWDAVANAGLHVHVDADGHGSGLRVQTRISMWVQQAAVGKGVKWHQTSSIFDIFDAKFSMQYSAGEASSAKVRLFQNTQRNNNKTTNKANWLAT